MQHALKQPSDIMKVTHYPTPPSMPAAAAAAAAMHAGMQHQHSAQIQDRTNSHLDASSPLTVSPSSSRSPSPAGMLSCMAYNAFARSESSAFGFCNTLLSGTQNSHTIAATHCLHVHAVMHL